MDLPSLYYLLYDAEHRLEQAREAGNPNDIERLLAERAGVNAAIEARKSKP